MNNILASDDFDSGINDLDLIEHMSPHIVKLDRDLISGIDHLIEKQVKTKKLVFYRGYYLAGPA